MADGLFGHLVLRFAAHPENLATEALHYVIDTHAPCRAAFDHLVGALGGPTEQLVWRTQVGTESGAVPDLAGFDSEGGMAAAIEAKFWAGLTDHQPVTYLGHLRSQSPRLLLFVAPPSRLGLLWQALARRVTDAGFRLVADAAPRVPGAHTATVSDGQRLALLGWSALTSALADAAAQASDRRALADVEQLAGLCNRMDTEAFLPLRSEELAGIHGRRITQYVGLVNRAVDALVRSEHATLRAPDGSVLKATATDAFIGRYLNIAGVTCLLRVSFTAWGRDDETPIWLQIGWRGAPPTQRVRSWLAEYELDPSLPVVVTRPTFVDVAIPLLTGEEEAAVVDDMVGRLQRLAALIGAGANQTREV